MKPSVAWIGLGTMGAPMARNLLRAVFPLAAFNRTRERAEPLRALGARIARSPFDAASEAEVVVVTVATPEAFHEVLAGPAGLIGGLRKGSLLIDMGTDGVEAAREGARLAATRGGSFVDAPVLGSRRPAEEGKLVVMAGGEPRDVGRAKPIFEPLARAVFHVGGVGSGQAMKLATNLMLAHMLTGLAGAISFAGASGLSPSDLVDVLDAGLASPYFRSKGAQMVSGAFEPQFTLDLVRKDLGLIQSALAEAGMAFPTIGPIAELFEEAARRGWGREDGAAVVKLWSR